MGVVNVIAEVCWLGQLLTKVCRPLQKSTFVYSDNESAVLCTDPRNIPVLTQRFSTLNRVHSTLD